MRRNKDDRMSNRVLTELIEADVEQVFSLVDMSEERAALGNHESGTQILQAAERVLANIEQRLLTLSSPDASPFLPLLGELRRAIENARSHIQ
jgi:hypothetical protein